MATKDKGGRFHVYYSRFEGPRRDGGQRQQHRPGGLFRGAAGVRHPLYVRPDGGGGLEVHRPLSGARSKHRGHQAERLPRQRHPRGDEGLGGERGGSGGRQAAVAHRGRLRREGPHRPGDP